MNFVNSLKINDIDAKEIPCIKGNGAPTTATEGAVGCLYMDIASGDIYKCTAVASGSHTWVLINSIDEILVMSPTYNLFNKDSQDNEIGYLLEGNTKVPVANYGISHFIQVKEGATYCGALLHKVAVVYLASFYDAEGNYISNANKLATVTEGEPHYAYFTVPTGEGITQMRISYSVALANQWMVFEGNSAPTSYIPYVETLKLNDDIASAVNAETNPLWSKVISFTGDSICESRSNNGGSYPTIIGARNNMIVENKGVSGGKITEGTTDFCISASVLNMRADADYIILEGGVNDMTLGNLGTISNGFTATLDTTTFCGAFEQMIKNALSRFEGKKIGYIAVHRLKQWAPDEYNTSFPNTGYYEAAIKICKKWGIPVCDLMLNCPSLYENTNLKEKYTTNADGWHPNEEGYKKYYVPKIEAWLKTL